MGRLLVVEVRVEPDGGSDLTDDDGPWAQVRGTPAAADEEGDSEAPDEEGAEDRLAARDRRF
jgi:hypothetical protein